MSLGAWLVAAVVVAWLLFTQEGRQVLAFLLYLSAGLLALVTLVTVAGCDRGSTIYRCSFNYQAATYQVPEHELRKRGSLIIVKRNGREYAFKRDSITACEIDQLPGAQDNDRSNAARPDKR